MMNDDLSNSKFSINLELIFFVYDGFTLLIGNKNMFKITYSPKVSNDSQDVTGTFRFLPNVDEIYELLNSSGLDSKQTKVCFDYINSLKFTNINDIKIFIKKYIDNYHVNIISGNNIDKSLKDSNSIMDNTDPSLEFIPKMLSDDLLKILELVVHGFEFFFPKNCKEEYKEQFIFLYESV